MQLFRVFAHHPSARPGTPGHPGYLQRQQVSGRWDNAQTYRAWYLSRTAMGAVGESFGNLGRWLPSMFETPYLPGGRRALAVFEVPDDLPILDLDDPSELARRQVRPSQIVKRNTGFTQPFALRAFREQNADGARLWAGLSWWSFHRPDWTNLMLWENEEVRPPQTLLRIEPLDLSSPAVVDAANELIRPVDM